MLSLDRCYLLQTTWLSASLHINYYLETMAKSNDPEDENMTQVAINWNYPLKYQIIACYYEYIVHVKMQRSFLEFYYEVDGVTCSGCSGCMMLSWKYSDLPLTLSCAPQHPRLPFDFLAPDKNVSVFLLWINACGAFDNDKRQTKSYTNGTTTLLINSLPNNDSSKQEIGEVCTKQLNTRLHNRLHVCVCMTAEVNVCSDR